MDGTRILLLTGSTRSGSTNTAALRTIHRLAPAGIDTVFYEGMDQLPRMSCHAADRALAESRH